MAAPSRSNYGMVAPPQSGSGGALAPWLTGAKAGYDLYAGYKAGRARESMARYNANIIEQDAEAVAASYDASGRRLAKDQRGLKAKQRMSVASRGGLMGGTDLLTLADEAEKMQLDQLELVRQRDIGVAKAKHAAYLTRFEAKQAAKAGFGATLSRFVKKSAKQWSSTEWQF